MPKMIAVALAVGASHGQETETPQEIRAGILELANKHSKAKKAPALKADALL